jgi:hypothetical protein
MARMFDRRHLLRVGIYDLDRIRMELPGASVERFERSRRRLCGLRSAFRTAGMLARATPAELARIPRIRAEFRPGRPVAFELQRRGNLRTRSNRFRRQMKG